MQSALRRRLLFLLLTAQAATVLALVLTSGRISGAAEANHTARLLSSTAAESAEAVRAHLEPAEAIADLTSSLLTSSDVAESALQDTFQEALARTPQMSGAFVGSPDGDFLFVSRDGQNFRHKTTTVDDSDRTTIIEIFSNEGELLDSFEDPTDDFDPSGRPWFVGAMDTPSEAVWTDPYVFFTSGQLGITASRAIIRDGEAVGVVGADIELGELSVLLAQLDTSDDGGTILVDRSSTVIAHPNADLLRVPDGDGFRTVSILEFDDIYAQSATSVLLADGDMEPVGVQDFDDAGAGSSRVAFEGVQIGNLDWTLGVYAPSGAIVEELTAARGQERLLTIFVGTTTILLLGLFALPATRDIEDLEEIAATDTLTGLPNRRVIMASATSLALDASDRAVAMLDIDLFKQVNDEFGHQVGDEVLLAVANRLSSAIPDGAEIGRVGGEEFLILLPRHDATTAERTTERLRQTVRNIPVDTSVGNITVSVSIGVAAATQASNRDTLISIADTALREAKGSGRDSVVIQRVNPNKEILHDPSSTPA